MPAFPLLGALSAWGMRHAGLAGRALAGVTLVVSAVWFVLSR
jgi:hypothetical protein